MMIQTPTTAEPGETYWMLMLVMSRAFLSLIFMSYAAGIPVLMREWSMTGARAGLVQTSFTGGFAVSLFAASWLSDHLGARPIFLWSCWMAAGASIAFALFARSMPQAAWLYGAVGFELGGSYTPSIMLVAQRMPALRRGRSVGWVLAGMSAGYIVSIRLTQGLIAAFDVRVAFLVCALGTVAGAIFGTIAVRNDAAWRSPPRPPLRDRARLGKRRSVLLTIGYVCHCREFFGMWAWAPAFLVASIGCSFALGDIGLGIAIGVALHLSAFFASISLGWASDRCGRRVVLLVVAAAGTVCSLGFGWSGGFPPAVLLAFAAVYGFAALGDSSVLSTAMTEAVREDALGRALAVRSILGIGAGAVAPAAFGLVLDASAPGAGWGLGFVLMSVGGAVAMVCAALLPSDR